MFNMSDLSNELQSTEKSYIFPLKYTVIDSVLLNPSEILPEQNRVGKFHFYCRL